MKLLGLGRKSGIVIWFHGYLDILVGVDSSKHFNINLIFLRVRNIHYIASFMAEWISFRRSSNYKPQFPCPYRASYSTRSKSVCSLIIVGVHFTRTKYTQSLIHLTLPHFCWCNKVLPNSCMLLRRWKGNNPNDHNLHP